MTKWFFIKELSHKSSKTKRTKKRVKPKLRHANSSEIDDLPATTMRNFGPQICGRLSDIYVFLFVQGREKGYKFHRTTKVKYEEKYGRASSSSSSSSPFILDLGLSFLVFFSSFTRARISYRLVEYHLVSHPLIPKEA